MAAAAASVVAADAAAATAVVAADAASVVAADAAAATAVVAADASEGPVDRLSNLPEEILLDILSRLCTDEMVRTSVLSLRWRSLWTFSPVLHFTHAFSRADPDFDDYPAIIDDCLLLCSASRKLRSIRFPLFNDPAFPSTLHRWLLFAAARDVEELTLLSPIFGCRARLVMPDSLSLCHRLSVLCISGTSIPSIPSAGFPHLRTITLTYVGISDASLLTLLSSCLGLEHLSLSHLKEITGLTVRGLALQHLMIYDCCSLDRVEIEHAPELLRFLYSGSLSVLSLSQNAVPKLEEAALLSPSRLVFRDPLVGLGLVGALAHVKVLSVNSWLFEFIASLKLASGRSHYTGPIFNNLQELHWWPVFRHSSKPGQPWFAEKFAGYFKDPLPFLIDCPSLEKLCISLGQEDATTFYDFFDMIFPEDSSYCDDSDHEIDPFEVYKVDWYTLPRLKTFSLAGFSGKKEEVGLVGFLVEKAAALERVYLHYVEEMCPELNRIQKELLSFVGGSRSTACIILTVFAEDEVCSKHDNMWGEFMVI